MATAVLPMRARSVSWIGCVTVTFEPSRKLGLCELAVENSTELPYRTMPETVTWQTAATPAKVATMSTLPPMTAVTRPLDETVASAGLLVAQSTGPAR